MRCRRHFFTGFSRYSFDIQVKTRAQLRNRTQELLELKELVEEAEMILADKDKDLDDFGRLLDYSWQMKRRINTEISTDAIDLIYDKAKKAGALGGKILGAGGGGFILFYAAPDKQASVRHALADLLYVPFQFDETGADVIYYMPEFYAPEGKRKMMDDDVFFDDYQGNWVKKASREELRPIAGIRSQIEK